MNVHLSILNLVLILYFVYKLYKFRLLFKKNQIIVKINEEQNGLTIDSLKKDNFFLIFYYMYIYIYNSLYIYFIIYILYLFIYIIYF
jgi:hypothetical protein